MKPEGEEEEDQLDGDIAPRRERSLNRLRTASQVFPSRLPNEIIRMNS
jgi:hypothetical protein